MSYRPRPNSAEPIFGAGLSLFWPLVDGSRTWIARFRLGNQ